MTITENPARRDRRRSALLVVALSVTCALLTTPGQAQAASGDYIVMLRPDVSLQAHLKALKITPNRLYTYTATGYEAVLNDTQYKRVLASSDVTIVTPNTVVTTVPTIAAPSSDPPPQQPQIPSTGMRRIGGLLSPTAAVDGIGTRIGVDVAVVDSGVDATHPGAERALGFKSASRTPSDLSFLLCLPELTRC